MSHEEDTDDPVVGWSYFIGVLGILILLVSVFFVHGLYYDVTSRLQAQDQAESTHPSATLDMTWVLQQDALGKSDPRVDPATEATFPTMPIDQAMKLVQDDLRTKQGK